jgi:preprotein translocase subunit SecD
MRKNLTTRTIIIVVTILVCIYGIIGIPKSKTELMDNLKENIRLGLDLKGGSHLVMEVQVQDAVVGDARQTIEHLQEELKKQNITWTSMDVSDVHSVADADSVVITVKGIPAAQSGDFRTLAAANESAYILTALNSTDYSMKMKTSDVWDLKRETVARTIDTISNRINQLGVAETSVQQYGRSGSDYQILIQLPGVDDPARAKALIGTTAVLEITGVDKNHDRGFQSKDEALASLGGIIPLNEKLVRAIPRAGSQGEEWYLVDKIPVITGRDMRNARPGQEERSWQTSFTLSPDGGRKFGRFTGDHVGDKLAVILDNQIVSVATINERIEDSGRILGLST